MTATGQQTFTITYDQLVRLGSLQALARQLRADAEWLEEQLDYAIWAIHDKHEEDEPWINQFEADGIAKFEADRALRNAKGS